MRVPLRFVVVAVLAVDVVATVLVAQQLGVGWTLVWFLVAFVLGVLVMRRAGVQAWRALVGGRPQSGAVAGDTVLLFLAGLLLAIPGALTNALGLLLLVPPLRGLVRRWIVLSAGRRFANVRATFTTVRLADGSLVIPGEVVEDDSAHPPGRPGDPGDPDDPDDDGRPRRPLPPA